MELWTQLLDLINTLVSPDWGALVALLPILLAVLVVAYVVWFVVRYASAGPTRHGGGRRTPQPPGGLHMPGPSLAPIFGAAGAFALLYGLVFGGLFIVAGLAILVLALLYWLRESMTDYDHLEPQEHALLRPGDGSPPPGIHMPGPSFRPITASLAMAILVYGLVFGGWMLLVGFLCLVIALLQWLMDARREYVTLEVTDATGHPPAAPRPHYPVGTLAVFAVLVLGAAVLQTGLLPPRSASGEAAAPTGSSGGGQATAAPAPTAPQGDVTIVAHNIAYEQSQVTAPANKAFTISFTNQDAGIPHNVSIHKDGPGGQEVWKGEIFNGVASRLYQVPALAPGTYTFQCSVHPSMTGTLVVK